MTGWKPEISAIMDEIRLRKPARVKSMAGKMEFSDTANEIRYGDSDHLENDPWDFAVFLEETPTVTE